MVRRILLTAALLLATFPVVGPSYAAELVVDNSDGGVQVKGKWSNSSTTSGFLGADYLFRTPGDGSSSVTWPLPAGATAGQYEVFARWTSGPNRASNATYQITSNSGSSNVSVSQKVGGGAWHSLGVFAFQPNKSQGVTLTDKADGVVVADAIRFVGPQTGAQPPVAPQQQNQQVAAIPPQPNDARFFVQTGYRVSEDAFWEYFSRRGGVRSFGYPVSNTFTLFGLKTQIFQRQILQQRPDGGVQPMNILDEGLMPYTRMNGSTFPAPDPAVMNAAPKVDAPNYHEDALQFVRTMAPDTFDGEPVNFSKTFFSSVSAQDAYPNGIPDGGDALVPFFNLEIWGLPTSKPMHDPSNPSFIYQRFQRGIMHYDKSCSCTQGLLLADYVKSLLTKRNLPSDLADEAKASKLLGQFAPGQARSVARANDLPGTDLSNAFRKDPSVTLDAGHGGTEIGASHVYADGTVLQEKEINLRVMLRLRDLLQQAGVQVTVTRTTDGPVNRDGKDLTGDGKVTLSDDLQARIDTANQAGSDIFVSVHFNGQSDPNARGTYIFYDPDRPFADRSKTLATLMDQALTAALKNAGYTSIDHGPTPDTSVLSGDHYYLLSPQTNIVPRPSNMPAIIAEGLFLTNDDDANALRKDAIVEAVARGYADGIKAYFAKYPPS